jgi:hypothetical protein
MTIKKLNFYFILFTISLIYTQDCDPGFTNYFNVEIEYPNVTIQDLPNCTSFDEQEDCENNNEYCQWENNNCIENLDFGNYCFNDGDLQALSDILSANDFEETMIAFNLGTQTWNEGRLRFLVAGYYFNGVETQIHTIPESISNLNDLRKLYLEWNNITELPNSFSNLTALVQLYISNNQLISLPDDFGNLDNLFILDLGYNQINSLPNSFVDLTSLTYLWLFNNQLSDLPNNFCDLGLDWDGDDYFGYPYFAIGGNMLCENVPGCVANSEHLNTSLEQYYYSVQITVEQDCSDLNIEDHNQNTSFNLNTIYPNPFNPITNIEISIFESEKISVSIFDMNGKMVTQLINNQFITPGSYNIKWNAIENASGIYFVNITNGITNKTQKIILQK